MTAMTALLPAPSRVRRAARSGEALVFTAATAVALLHALDDAFLHRQPGVGLGQHALAAAFAVVGALAAVAAFPALRPGLRAGLALSLGSLALVNGFQHLNHISVDGPSHSDLTGVLAAAAGLVLVALAVAIPWRHRGSGTWRSRALAAVALPVTAIAVLGPVGMAQFDAHKWREAIGEPPNAAYQPVAFKAADGLDIKGWYRPSSNGATMLVVHGGGGDRTGAMRHAQMLARNGYGVLAYDARGRGESEGSPNGYGWDWEKDVSGALSYLHSRPEVDRDRIGALGLSTGADVLLHVAAERDDLAAVVSDGAAASSYDDWARLRGADLGAVPGRVMFSTIRVLTGDAPPPPLQDQVARIEEPLMLIGAGVAEEHQFNELYADAAPHAEHWAVDAGHTAALRERPREYEQRVVGFLDRALAPQERAG
jgi:dienelactone hydrolase